jgi:hypothetical protein
MPPSSRFAVRRYIGLPSSSRLTTGAAAVRNVSPLSMLSAARRATSSSARDHACSDDRLSTDIADDHASSGVGLSARVTAMYSATSTGRRRDRATAPMNRVHSSA